MNNLILNLDAQLWIFDSTPDSQKFAIENISSKKVGKILTLFPFFFFIFSLPGKSQRILLWFIKMGKN